MRRGPWLAPILLVLTGTARGASAVPELRLVDVSSTSGLEFSMTSGKTPSREIVEVNGGGVALIDHDGDGDLDVFLANGATMDDPERGPGSRLYANDGKGKFRDVSAEVELTLRRWATGVAVGDFDGDGDDDLYVACFGRNVLLRNDAREDGTRRLVDVTDRAGVAGDQWSTSAAFSDLDADGDLDLYVANYLAFDVKAPPDRTGKLFKGAPVFAGPAGLPAQHDVLYENLGNGTFRDVTATSGCRPARAGYGMGVAIVDFDGDGRQDIFVGNDSMENWLFKNRGDWKFEEIGVAAGVASNYDGRNQATMGIAIGDVDGNGRPSVFTTNFSSDTNTLHVNLGGWLFDDRTSQYGLAAVSRPFLSWGTGFYDFDSDGDEDLLIASGHIYPEANDYEIDSDYEQPVLFFERNAARFERNLTAGEMLTKRYSGRSTAFGDLDEDGDVDVVMTVLNGPVRVFRNDAPTRPVVVVDLQGKGGNRHALGATVELVTAGAVQRRFLHGGSFQSVDAPLAYFGLGGSEPGRTATLRVAWPSGKRVEYLEVPTDRKITLVEGAATPRSAPLRGR